MRTRDGVLQRLQRRIVSIPLVIGGGAVLLSLLPLLVVAGVLIDLVLRRVRWSTLRLFVWAPLALVVEQVGLASLFFVWLFTVGSTQRRAAATYAVQRAYTAAHFSLVQRLFDVQVKVDGNELGASGPLLIFIRHVSIIDTLLPGVVLANAHALRLRYVLKRELLWEPCLDVAGHFIPNHFVARDGADTQAELDAIAKLAVGLSAHDGVLIYPEGTRATAGKRARLLEKLEGPARAEAESLGHVLPVRAGGIGALLDTAPEADVLFVGHRGLEGLASLQDIWRGRLVGRVIEVKLWREAAASVPLERAERLAWVKRQWQRLDAWVGG